MKREAWIHINVTKKTKKPQKIIKKKIIVFMDISSAEIHIWNVLS